MLSSILYWGKGERHQVPSRRAEGQRANLLWPKDIRLILSWVTGHGRFRLNATTTSRPVSSEVIHVRSIVVSEFSEAVGPGHREVASTPS